jgi:putative membrane protein
MTNIRSLYLVAAAVLVAGALAACNRKDEVPRPKTEASGTVATPTAPAAGAPADRTAAPAPTATVPEGDRAFVDTAASAGLAEVAITKHTMAKAASDDVRKLAEHLNKDHSQANRELTSIASAKGIPVPAAPEGDKRGEVEQITALSGAELDRTVLQKLEKSHRESIKLFEREASEGSDPELKAFAAKTLPTLREHLKMVESTPVAAGDGGVPAANK